MPKYTETEGQFWEMMLKWANAGYESLICNICEHEMVAASKEGQDHFFGITHKGYNIYDIFSKIPIDPRTLLRIDGVPKLI